MWMYEKKLEYPVRVFKNDIGMAKLLAAQYGGPDSELSAGVRYLTQRYSMPTNMAKGILTDIGTEELAHWD
jgi:spore coat protein JC